MKEEEEGEHMCTNLCLDQRGNLRTKLNGKLLLHTARSRSRTCINTCVASLSQCTPTRASKAEDRKKRKARGEGKEREREK